MLGLLRLFYLLVWAACSTAQFQVPLAWTYGANDSPARLSGVGDGEPVILAHPAFPKHAVRISRVKGFCDTTVGMYTGYVDIEAKHFFFWFFESRRDPDQDDVMLWLNGGPGSSSMMGMLMELGPCNIAGPNATVYNPYSWTSYANMIFLDQPIDVGFSYADHGETVSRAEDAGVDVAAFFAILSESFPQFQGRRLHLAGESYGGRYLPVFASAIVDHNPHMEHWGLQPINLASVVIGNGLSDIYSWFAFRYDAQCTNVTGVPPVHSISTCVHIKQMVKHCRARIQAWCYDVHDVMNCAAAEDYCNEELLGRLFEKGINPYDLSKKCEGTVACYTEAEDIQTLLSSPYIRKLIRTDDKPANFTMMSWAVNQRFINAGDMTESSTAYLAGLLERGIRVLIYSGMYDASVSWVESEYMTRIIEWTGQDAFGKAPLREWQAYGEENSGKVRSWGPLSFVTLYAAGHLVPHDKPMEALEMVRRWLAEEAV